jgi:hypothetical protein
MATIKLITLQDIAVLKPMSINTDVIKQLEPFILEAQEFDIREVLGDPLYFNILADAPDFNTPKYDKLFNGCEYVFEGKNYKHEGIKACLVYYTYARYLQNSNAHATPFGMRVKNHNYSEPIDEKTLSRMVKQTQSGAISYQNRFMEYMKRFSNEYEVECSTKLMNDIKTSTKIRHIRR